MTPPSSPGEISCSGAVRGGQARAPWPTRPADRLRDDRRGRPLAVEYYHDASGEHLTRIGVDRALLLPRLGCAPPSWMPPGGWQSAPSTSVGSAHNRLLRAAHGLRPASAAGWDERVTTATERVPDSSAGDSAPIRGRTDRPLTSGNECVRRQCPRGQTVAVGIRVGPWSSVSAGHRDRMATVTFAPLVVAFYSDPTGGAGACRLVDLPAAHRSEAAVLRFTGGDLNDNALRSQDCWSNSPPEWRSDAEVVRRPRPPGDRVAASGSVGRRRGS
jgi:hypothetical protein